MKKAFALILIFVSLLFTPAYAQKVGLVLSGGGAKGMTHIGIIRALEENNIPIDYITGTSMGAIVGSLYAMGYSPDDMEKLLKSPDFKKWYSSRGIEEEYMYYFKMNPPTPEFINIRLSKLDMAKKVKTRFLPSSVVDPMHMNIAFVELYAQATAKCRGNFDNLLIPFRCVASDVYNKRPLIMSKGDLGDAVRASMSFPGMFKPIEIDSVLAYDGGIYDNFPVSTMINDFHPDVIIGSVVSSNPSKPKEGDIMSQLENMVMQKTDYSIPDSLGILMTFKYTDVGLMDFDRYDELHDIGYNRTIQLMDSITQRISRRTSYRILEKKRIDFRREMPEMNFRKIIINGTNEQQKKYIMRGFHAEENDVFNLEELRKGYFRLLSDKMISEILPHVQYDYNDSTFTLILDVKVAEDLSVRIGGNVGSNGANQIYMGASYHNLGKYSKEFAIEGQLGQIYNNLQLTGRIDLPTEIPTSYRMIVSLSSFDYKGQTQNFFNQINSPVFNKKDEKFVKVCVSMPFLSKHKAEFGIGAATLDDQYFQTNVIDFTNSTRDKSKYNILGGTVALEGNTLDSRLYAVNGKKERLAANIYWGTEKFQQGTGTDPYEGQFKYTQAWLQISYELEKYFRLGKKVSLGSYLHTYYSSRNFSNNYRATMMQAGEFSPTTHSKITYNEAFRANQFAGIGLIPIYRFNNTIHARLGVYGFLPFFPINCNESNKATYGKIFSKFEYLSDLSIVVRLPFGSISAYLNYYSSPKNNWNAGISLGWQIFGERFMQ
ncbi:patatin-like phospholipase family protein [Bacteroides caecigallinarum]|uniref:patatin-like phospholipase family protein n=1 Tax=Bacteroides caecigallinarum TaxID=1411144 RepID=UPI001F39FB60|nr:patatin-like phospholipase family protein [Bacteroides caecigallinarum]MCF2551902.1 patatin-like phospholipase family protein [Bacteroides caecigallinarum]